MILTTQDCIDVGICTLGQIRFCHQHGIDFRRFTKEGLPFAALAGIDDFNLTRAMTRAEQRAQEIA